MSRLGSITRPVLQLALVVAPAAALVVGAHAKVFLTVDQALALVFEGCQARKETVFLTDAQLAEVSKLSGDDSSDRTSKLVVRHLAACPKGSPKEGSVAYVDARVVRTKGQALMVVVGSDGKVRRTELLSFDEPPDYIPKEQWYGQFQGKSLSGGLELKREIAPVTGATLTARATTRAVRRALAIHRILGAGFR